VNPPVIWSQKKWSEKWGSFVANQAIRFITTTPCAPSQRDFLTTTKLVIMPWNLTRYYGNGDLHFITCGCYQRQPGALRFAFETWASVERLTALANLPRL
jgi:hypothetical protein